LPSLSFCSTMQAALSPAITILVPWDVMYTPSQTHVWKAIHSKASKKRVVDTALLLNHSFKKAEFYLAARDTHTND
jgi:hypothetical protein